MTFTTKSGSTYEVDEREKKIRWLSGSRRHSSFPPDRQWRSFYSMTFVEVGYYVVICWEEPPPTGRVDATTTSAVDHVHGQRAA